MCKIYKGIQKLLCLRNAEEIDNERHYNYEIYGVWSSFNSLSIQFTINAESGSRAPVCINVCYDRYSRKHVNACNQEGC